MIPRPPTFDELAAEARDGDGDAAFVLAQRAPDKGFLSWLARWVPEGEMSVSVFDTFSDAYQRMECEKAVERVKREVPVPDDLKEEAS